MTSKIQFSLTVSNRSPLIVGTPVRELLELAEMADEAEVFDAVMVGDSMLTKPRLESVSMLSAIASRTERVKLGVACMSSLPLREPILLANQWATLDQLSNGRTILVACIGGAAGRIKGEEEFQAFGRQVSDRVGLMREVIEVLRKLWTEDSVTYHGRFHHLNNVHLEPKPVQKNPPIWIAVRPPTGEVAEVTYKRIARLSDGWMSLRLSPEDLRRGWDKIQRYSQEFGRTVPICSLYSNMYLDNDREKALKETKNFLDKYYFADFSREVIEAWGVYGSRADCIKRIESFMSAGLNFITFRPTTHDAKEQVKRWTKDVLSSF